MEQKTIDDISSKQGELDRLKKIGKVRKPFTCSDCKKDFEVGSPCYNQSDYREVAFFPIQRRICLDCGEIQISNGIEVKESPKKKPKTKVPEEIYKIIPNWNDLPSAEKKIIISENPNIEEMLKTKDEEKEEITEVVKIGKGCGKDTIYPKPNKLGMWKCGEESLIGALFCDGCKKNE